MTTFFAGDLATPNIKAWRFVLDEGNYWLLTAMQGALGELAITNNWVQAGDVATEEAAELGQTIIDSLEPTLDLIGLVLPFAGAAGDVPDGALLCDGASYLRTNLPDLFTVIGTTYGATDGTHFNVPDLRGRTVLGVGTGSGLTPRVLAATGGEETHTLNTGEMPSHVHTTGNSLLLGTSVPPPLDALGPNPLPAFTGSAGGDGAHNNMQPFIALNYIIVAVH